MDRELAIGLFSSRSMAPWAVRFNGTTARGTVLRALLLLLVVTIATGRAAAQSASESADGKPRATAAFEGVALETLAAGLASPVAIIVRPASANGGPDVFVADREAGKVVALDSRGGGEAVDVVTGFAPGEAQLQRAGALLGLMFLNRSVLLVATEGANPEEQLVAHYNLRDEEWPLSAEAATTTSKLAQLDGQNAAALPTAGIARNVGNVFVTAPSGLVFRAAVTGTELKSFVPFNNLAASTGGGRLTAITFSEKGYLVAALAGAAEEKGDSKIAFCHPYEKDTEPLLVVEPGLHDIVALAYSPETGNLYAADYSESEPAEGGVYRIDAHRDEETKKMGAQAVLVARVASPTALAFVGDGTLLVAATLQAEDESDATGVVLKLMGEL